MGQEAYYVSHEGQQQGPYSVKQIVSEVKSGNLSALDYVFDESKNDWVLFWEFAPLASHISELKPKTAPKPPAQTSKTDPELEKISQKMERSGQPAEHLVTEWYVLKGENKFGPFAFTDVVKMLQQKIVFEFDFVWHPGMSTWKRLAELSAFQHENIKQLQDTLMPEIEEVFFRRRHRRVSFNATVLIHDNHSIWKGHGVEISPGGAGVVMENSLITPGQVLYLHFKPGDGVPPFNAICEVVSKKFVDGVKDKSAPIRYGLKFTSISPSTQKFLQEFTKKSEAA